MDTEALLTTSDPLDVAARIEVVRHAVDAAKERDLRLATMIVNRYAEAMRKGNRGR